MSNFDVCSAEIPALKPQLLAQLETAIRQSPSLCESVTIPLTRAKNTPEIIYLSPIALKLKANQLETANQLAAHLATAVKADLNFTVEVIPPGWLQLHLTDSGLATWLQKLISASLHLPVFASPPPIASSLFSIQYTHARCCSLLHTGHREGLIVLNADTRQVMTPDPIPWLNSLQCLCFPDKAELALISCLADTLDALATTTPQNPVKLATGLSFAFERFHSACRIWGDIKTQTPYLAQARLGLIRATQTTLKLILKHFLAAEAPAEL